MIWLKISTTLMFLGVVLGAFGTHALKETLPPGNMETFKTGIFYHFVHALGLFAVAWIATHIPDPKVMYSGVFLTLGVMIFSGSLYGLALTGMRWMGALTPIGGMCFLIGWLLLFLSIVHIK